MRSVAAASALPAAEAGGDRDALVDRDRERRELLPGPGAELLERRGGEVVAGYARAVDAVLAGLASAPP